MVNVIYSEGDMDHDWKIKNSYIDLLHGDCIKRLRRMDDECVDSIQDSKPSVKVIHNNLT